MIFKPHNFFSFLKPHFIITSIHSTFHHHQWRNITKVRLKWVKNKSLDHIIDKETDLKAAMILKDAIKRSSTNFITAKTVTDWQKLLGLTIPVLRFLRRKVAVCSVNPTEQATLQCLACAEGKIPITKSYHCLDVWRHHCVLHDHAALS